MSKQPVADMRLSLLLVHFGFLLLFCGCSGTELRSSGPPGVAVWELENLTDDPQLADTGELLAAQIAGTLGSQPKYRVVERTRLVRILEEQHLSVSSLADPQTQLRLGGLVGARFMVFGGYQRLGSTVRIDIRLVNVETGKIVKALKREVASPDLQTLLDAVTSAAAEL